MLNVLEIFSICFLKLPISVVDVVVVFVVVWVVVRDCRYLGALCGLPAFAHIDKGRLSFCFNSLGNIVRGLFGVVRGLAEDLTLMPKNLFHVILRLFNGIDDFWVKVLKRIVEFKKGEGR